MPTTSQPSVKILVVYHKPAVLFKDDVLTPIHCGRALGSALSKDGLPCGQDNRWLLTNMPGDDTGDNISAQNRCYCEFTALYWAWKNYDSLGNPDYIGLMHYRRIFDFSTAENRKIPAGHEVQNAAKQLGSQIKQTLKTHDLITPVPVDLHKWNFDTVENYFNRYTPYPHHPDTLKTGRRLLQEKYPELTADFDQYLRGHEAFFSSMFVLSKKDFFQLCSFIFSLLEPFVQTLDLPRLSVSVRRAGAYWGEYLTGFWLWRLSKSRKAARVAQTFLTHTDLPVQCAPAFKHNNVAVLLSSDNKFAPYAGVCIQSVLAHASAENNYDLLLLDEDISPAARQKLQALCAGKANVSLRFIPVEPWLRDTDRRLFYVYNNYTPSTYYRLFAPEICAQYDKILYLDSDVVARRDVADLFNLDLKDNLIAAVHDPAISCRIREWPHFNKYVKETLQLSDPDAYLQAGVVLMNLARMRRTDFTRKAAEFLQKIKTPMYVDQDVLNHLCRNSTLRLPLKWNVLWGFPLVIKDWMHKMPADMYEEYIQSRRDPYIIHYGGPKPWQQPWQEMADVFWTHARNTPFYEEILYSNLAAQPVPQRNWEELIALAAAPHTRFLRYYRCKLLSKLTAGKKRAHYKEKAKNLHDQIRKIRQWYK